MQWYCLNRPYRQLCQYAEKRAAGCINNQGWLGIVRQDSRRNITGNIRKVMRDFSLTELELIAILNLYIDYATFGAGFSNFFKTGTAQKSSYHIAQTFH